MPLATSFRTKQTAESKPPADLVFSLVSLYFLNIHPWIPFLDIQRVFRDLGKGDEFPPLCHALFGISLPFSFDSRLTQNVCDSYWKYSKRRIFVDVLEEPSYSSLESLSILVLDLSGMTNGPQVWGALAIAVKLAIQLKTIDGRVLRVSTTEDEVCSQQSASGHRQRLFWVIYMIDSYISITTSHPSGLADYHVSHFLPTRDAVWMTDETENKVAPETMSPRCVFNYQLRLMDVSRMVHSTYLGFCSLSNIDESQISSWLDQFMECSKLLSEWEFGLPITMAVNVIPASPTGTETLPSLMMMHAYYHGLVLFLHGIVAFSGQTDSRSQFEAYRSSSEETCSKSVEAMSNISSSVLTQCMARFGWPLAWSIWIATRYVLITQHNGYPFSSQRITSFLHCLEQLAKYWQIAGKYWRLLRQALDEQQSGMVYEGGVLPFVVDQKLATSDLEDRFRVDSFFTATTTDTSSATTSQAGSLDVQFPSQQGSTAIQSSQDLFTDENEPWFLNLLNPSSAYQMAYPEFFDGSLE